MYIYCIDSSSEHRCRYAHGGKIMSRMYAGDDPGQVGQEAVQRPLRLTRHRVQGENNEQIAFVKMVF